MLYFLHLMDGIQKSIVRAALARVRGYAPTVMHGLYIGETPSERGRILHEVIAKHPRADAQIFSDVWAQQEEYLAGLRELLNHPGFKGGVCFVFEEFTRSDRLHFLMEINPDLIWVVIETHEKSGDPRHASWSNIIDSLKDLGLTGALVGGCYCVADEQNQPVRTDVYYSCVNVLYWELKDGANLEIVGIAGRATFAQGLDNLRALGLV
jgi:hypothetical protein